MDDNNLNHLIAVNVLVPRVASESSRLSVCEAERDVAQASCEAAWRRVHRLQEAIQLHKREIMGDEPDGADERLWSALSGAVPTPPRGVRNASRHRRARGDRVVEEVARTMQVRFRAAGTPVPWSELSPSERAAWRMTASHWVSLIRPLVAGVIADRLEEYVGHGRAARFVRREFVDGEA